MILRYWLKVQKNNNILKAHGCINKKLRNYTNKIKAVILNKGKVKNLNLMIYGDSIHGIETLVFILLPRYTFELQRWPLYCTKTLFDKANKSLCSMY